MPASPWGLSLRLPGVTNAAAYALSSPRSFAATPHILRVIANDFLCGAVSCLSGAPHKALKINRAVLAGEMTVSLAHPFVTGERRVLPDLPT